MAAAALLAGGTAYAAVSSSIPDSQGAIHGCYSANGATGTNGTPLNIIDSTQASCSKGQAAISWNQKGPQGPAGPGYTFTTASGISGPPLTADGSYFIEIDAGISSSTAPLTGYCLGAGPKGTVTGNPGGAFALPSSTGSQFGFSGIVTVSGDVSTAAPVVLELQCADTAGNAVTPDSIQWWVSPVGTSG